MSLAVSNLTHSVGGKRLLDGLSEEFLPGHLTVILGPNGAGKTTLLRLLAGELAADVGQVSYDGRGIDRISLKDRALQRAVMTQSSQVVFDFTVEEVLLMGWVNPDVGYFKAQFEYLLTHCQIGELLPRTFNTLSGGEQQRVQFARALLQLCPMRPSAQPRYLLLDEPTSSLDVAHELTTLELAKDCAIRGIAVVAVLHDLNLASRFADKIVLLAQGQIVASGVPADVLRAETLSAAYATPMQVEQHGGLGRLLVHT